jgi:Rod binding domain-containing protein
METTAIGSTASTTVPQKYDRDRIARVAREFESLFTSMMLKSMRKTIGENELMPASMGEKIYTSMLDDEYASRIGNQGTLGLAELIEKELLRHEGLDASVDVPATPAWMLDNRFVPQAHGGSIQSSGEIRGLSERLEQWNSLIDQNAAEHSVDRNLVAAVIAQESGGNQYAVSRAGAKGLMQLMDSTARSMGVTSSFDPQQNISGGVRYLRAMLDKYNGDVRLALASYNAGPGAVDKYNSIPPYRETQEYVRSVMAMQSAFARTSENREVEQ